MARCCEGALGDTYLPQSALYLTLTMTSVGSMIFGSGRSSSLTSSFPWKTTAFIVSFDILTFVYKGSIDLFLLVLRTELVRGHSLVWMQKQSTKSNEKWNSRAGRSNNLGPASPLARSLLSRSRDHDHILVRGTQIPRQNTMRGSPEKGLMIERAGIRSAAGQESRNLDL